MHDCSEHHKKDKEFLDKILRQISDFVVEKHKSSTKEDENLWNLVEETNHLLFNISANMIHLYSNDDEISFSVNAMRFIAEFALMIGKIQINKNIKECEYDD